MQVTPQLIDKLADLARLELDESSREELMRDLKEIIAFFEKLQEVDTTAVEPLIHITEQQNRLRNDEVKMEITRKEALRNAPLHDGIHMKVPKVIKK
ncbi:MAG TPA: Asp-tRNA(Asn)/Glu-tRNA(Gln) amidotransferase subunit GatC [Chitinophagales bacterium]|nr:Asp-tRNA(Asn)/Glu-tRNA(Gln) amidotransferase subunit GatC [Chitinophagales bacterium]